MGPENDKKHPALNNETALVSKEQYDELLKSGNLFFCIEKTTVSNPVNPGQVITSEEIVIKDRTYTVLLNKNNDNKYRVSVTRGQNLEIVTVELEFDDQEKALMLYLELRESKSNPMLQLEQAAQNKKSGSYLGMKFHAGFLPNHLSEEIRLPESALSVVKPSLRNDPLTGLKLRPGFIRIFDTIAAEYAPVISIGEIDVANLGAVNTVCGIEFGNHYFRELVKISQKYNKLKLFRHGGDEFSFVIFGTSESQNISTIESFLKDVNQLRHLMFANLSSERIQLLKNACVENSIKKGRKRASEALALYIGVVTIGAQKLSELCKVHETLPEQKGIVVQSLLGQAEKAVYNAKFESVRELVCVPVDENLPMRSADRLFISNLRQIDTFHDRITDAIKGSGRTLSRAERIILYRLISLVGAEDVSINNWTARSERLDPKWAFIGSNPSKASSIYIDFPAGILNDRIGPDRTDEFFSSILSNLHTDYPVVPIRESGGGFRLFFPVNQITDNELNELRETLTRRIHFHLSTIIDNINDGLRSKNHTDQSIKQIDPIPIDLFYVGRKPRPKDWPNSAVDL